ncbi:(3R)-3-hydroxyacyl-CoA dehydrogenase isoform X2 [Diceros bicornis minor]|uniref:(3R)-3-hydroxyacyl-CoA dehydrogenase isoform X2 n=1 Tax=Diceros bicornis minor TaxID=77932 RepID=UPI0026F30D19|nr:(3R)-3-hydroxyacyl-CoA dehydrogenase isoform X2 [Diceros bicornis minor]
MSGACPGTLQPLLPLARTLLTLRPVDLWPLPTYPPPPACSRPPQVRGVASAEPSVCAWPERGPPWPLATWTGQRHGRRCSCWAGGGARRGRPEGPTLPSRLTSLRPGLPGACWNKCSFSRPPSVVVSCAGITRDEFLLHMSEDDWDRVIAVNLKGIFLVTQAAAQALVSSGCHGSIINISSIVGKVGNMGQTNYAASKAGVIGLTQTVARELARHGIRCNSVLPGFITTPMTQKMPQKVLDKVTGMIPMGHMGDPEDVADVVAFLASEDSGYITGASVEVTGGLFM